MTKQIIILAIIFTSLIISSCDIIDEMLDRGNESVNNYNNISKIEVEYFIDNATYTSNGDVVSGVENGGEFSSVAGSSTFNNDVYKTTFDNVPVLGKEVNGHMTLSFDLNSSRKKVNVDLDQRRYWTSTLTSLNRGQYFKVNRSNIYYNKSYTDEIFDTEVDEYYLSGSSLTGISVQYKDVSTSPSTGFIVDESNLTSFSCGNRAFIKVKVHLK